MTVVVVGASGATGRLLVEQLVNRGLNVKVIVRSTDNLSNDIKNHPNLSIVHASVLDLSDADMALHTKGCDAVASCLGHNLTFKGMYGQPRLLVTDATRRLCDAIKTHAAEKPVMFVLMNTTGNRNRDLDEPISFAQKCVIGLIRLLIPPHSDNEKAADYLPSQVGQDNKHIEWAARPDGLLNEHEVSEYEVHPSPIRSAIFDAGTTSRINVAHFIADLITDDNIWQQWQGKMPVIYNKTTST